MTDQILIIYLIGVNVITFALFAVDKSRAVHGKWRIRERKLLGFSFLGGAIGGLLAMYGCHHKTQKKRFYIGLPLMVVLQALLVGYLGKTGVLFH